MRATSRLAALAAVVAATAGCGVGDDRDAARAATERFYAALAGGRGAAACDELAASTVRQLEGQSGQDCADAVTRLSLDGGEPARAEVYATNAKVDLTSGESAFLAPEEGRWKLSAVGCRPEQGDPGSHPLDCEVEA